MIIDSLRNFFKSVKKQKDDAEENGHYSSTASIQSAFVNADIGTADPIELEFKDPRKIGIIDKLGNHTTLTRFNPDEFENRIVKGIVSKIWKEEGLLNQWLIEVVAHVKSHTKSGTEIILSRKFVLFDNEIEWIRKLK